METRRSPVGGGDGDQMMMLFPLREPLSENLSGRFVGFFPGSYSLPPHGPRRLPSSVELQEPRRAGLYWGPVCSRSSLDKNLSLWNVKAQLKGNSTQDNDHRQWVTKARYSQSQKNEYFATVGRDGRLKFWSNLKCIASIQAHENYINALALSLNGQYIVTGGKDAEVKVWDYNDKSKPHAVYKTESEVNGLAFNLQYQLVAAATDKGVRVWDINAKSSSPLYSFELEPVRLAGDDKDKKKPNVRATAVTWSSNLRRLYVGGADGVIRVYNITLTSN